MRTAHASSAALALACCVLGRSGAAAADGRETEVDEVGVGLTAGSGNGGEVGSLALGVDAWYRPIEPFAAGIEVQGLYFDNMEYCTRCIEGTGVLGVVFAEARAFPRSTVSAFVRLGLGAARWAYVDENYESDGKRPYPVALLAVGPQVTVWRVFFRLRGGVTATPTKDILSWGVELGGLVGD